VKQACGSLLTNKYSEGYPAYCQPGDTRDGDGAPMGGHLAHGWNVSVMGKWFHSVQYTVQHDSGRVDLDEVRDLARRERPKLIFCGGTAIPRTIDFPGFAEIAGEVGGAHPSPVGHAGHLDHDPQDAARPPRRHITAGMAVALHEAARPQFRDDAA
jgi:glycine hydroxymethyltransferase